jgi:hypothetical protein
VVWQRRGQKERSGSSPKLWRRKRGCHDCRTVNSPRSRGSKAWSSWSQSPTTAHESQEAVTSTSATPPKLLRSIKRLHYTKGTMTQNCTRYCKSIDQF